MPEQKTETGDQPTQFSEFVKQMMAACGDGKSICGASCCGAAGETGDTEKK